MLSLGYSTPFWDAVRQLEALFGITEGQVLWSNLNKLDEEGDRLSPEVEDEMVRIFPGLPQEIALANPDVVVFFTVPHFADLLYRIFPGAEMNPVPRYERFLASVSYPTLPERAFRTYHPKFLRIQRQAASVFKRMANSQ